MMKRPSLTRYRTIAVGLFIILAVIGGFARAWHSQGLPAKIAPIYASAGRSRSIHYCDTQDAARTVDLYYPKHAASGALPLVVYVHGGGWRGGGGKGPILNLYGAHFLRKGIAVAAVHYRLSPANSYPAQNDDVACALSYIDDNADRLGVDPKRIIYFGDSAGGQLAAFAGLNIPYHGYDYEAPVGVVDFYGVSDFSAIVNGGSPDINARRYLGSKYNKVAVEASPTTYIATTKDAPSFLLFHGTKDRVVPISQSQSFYERLISAGVTADYVVVDGARHGFNGTELPPVQFKMITDHLDAFLRHTIHK